MNLQRIKSITGQDEYVLLPVETYHVLKKQIDKILNEDYDKFKIEDYVQNPIALARIRAHLTLVNTIPGILICYFNTTLSRNPSL